MSLRLWNLETGVCTLVFSGEGGHRNEILSVVCLFGLQMLCTLLIAPRTKQDFHPSDVSRFVSAGMDYSIKIWAFNGAQRCSRSSSLGEPQQ